MTPQQWKAKGQYIDYNGHQIFYRKEGQGEVLLLIHGFPTATHDWHKIWSELTARFIVIAPDMLGFGYSDKPTDYDYHIHNQADIMEYILSYFKVNRYHIFAHDYGDTVAQELLARHVERAGRDVGKGHDLPLHHLQIESLCLLNGGIFPHLHRARPIQKLLLNSFLGPLVSSFSSKKTVKKNFDRIFGKDFRATDQEIDEFWEVMTYQQGQKILYKLIHYINDRKKHEKRWVDALKNAIIPMLLINGPEDPVSGRHVIETYRKLVPQSEVVVLEGVGHYPHFEDPIGTLHAFFSKLHPDMIK